MGSLQKKYTTEKLKGKIYTPQHIVEKILNLVGYTDSTILGKSILDPACGEGVFLMEIAKRIILYSKPQDLETNLYALKGWDIDAEAIQTCRENLDELIAGLDLGLKIDWQIELKDAILAWDSAEKFDFIIANPPYIRIQHLAEPQRKYLQHHYHFCKAGSTDIYVAFFELALHILSADGIAGFITPNTYFYTETAKFLREHLSRQQNLLHIINYGDIQLFGNATTYSAITIFNTKSQQEFQFEKAIDEQNFTQKTFKFDEIKNPTWNLSTENQEIIHGLRLAELAHIHVGITTLCDKAYLFGLQDLQELYNENSGIIRLTSPIVGDVLLEKKILKPIIKGSTLKSSDEQIFTCILFPYHLIEQKHQIIPESVLAEEYPLTYSYLCSVRDLLDKRDNGKPNTVAWYAFGRSQGLDTSFGKKIIFSPMNKEPNFIYSDNNDATFYSGYCIKPKREININKLLQQLNSERMRKFVEVSSRDFRGGWKAYNKKVIENFIIDIEAL
jgi:adenine-specific DNA-methyltransferase